MNKKEKIVDYFSTLKLSTVKDQLDEILMEAEKEKSHTRIYFLK